MNPDSPNWIVMGDPASPEAAAALEIFRDLLPENGRTRAWANLTFIDLNGRSGEIDILLLTKRGFYVVELKGWHSTVTGNQQSWRQTTRGGQVRHFANSYLGTDGEAKRLSSLLRDVAGKVQLPYLGALVVMHGHDSKIALDELGRTNVLALDGYGVEGGLPSLSTFLASQPDRPSHQIDLEAAALLLLWRRGFVEPAVPPPHPQHLVAQQLLALALQEGAFGVADWSRWWGESGLMHGAEEILDHLMIGGFLVEDSGLLMIGPAAERAFGRRHFLDLLSSFTAERELRALVGNKELGFLSPLALPRTSRGVPKDAVLINGRSWHVEAIDWQRFTVHVSPAGDRGDVRWSSEPIALSFELMRAQRDVLLGHDSGVPLTLRAQDKLASVRKHRESEVDANGLVLQRSDGDVRLWTWAGLKANETLRAALGNPAGRSSNDGMTIRNLNDTGDISRVDVDGVVPHVPGGMVDALKFSAALPEELAVRTLAERFADDRGATAIVEAPQIRQASR